MNSSPASTGLRPSYRAILWDNDGVLVDTERWYYLATREVLAGAGIDLTEELYFTHFLKSASGVTELAQQRGYSDAQIDELRDLRNARYEHFLATKPLPMPGAEETLRALRPHFTMGVVTSSRRDHFEMMHARTGFLKYFDFVLAQGDYACSKPAPDPYLRGVERSGVPAAQCLAIEDAPRGLAAARAAGIDCWVIPADHTRSADFPGAKKFLRSLAEMSALLG